MTDDIPPFSVKSSHAQELEVETLTEVVPNKYILIVKLFEIK